MAQPAPVVAPSAPNTNNAQAVAQAKSYAALNSNTVAVAPISTGKSSVEGATGSKASGVQPEKKASTAQAAADSKKSGKVADQPKDGIVTTTVNQVYLFFSIS